MKVLVAYSSRHGATRGIAERIATTLEREGVPVAFKSVEEVEWVDGFDAFVIGSSAYMGHWEKDAQAFVREHADVLSTRPVWLYSSGPVGAEKVDKKGIDVLVGSRPAEFAEFGDLIHPRAEQVFFGMYDPDRKGATLGEKLILKVPGMREVLPAGDFRDWPAIEAWAEGIARELKPALAAAGMTA